jgi:hypothetical protein
VHLAELFLWVVAAGMAGHALLSHGVLVCLLLLEVALVVQRSLGRHVGLGDGVVVGRHTAWLASRDLGVVVLGRLDRVVSVDAICIAARRLGRVQTRLGNVSQEDATRGGAMPRTWIRFLPSGLVTSGCSLGVVNV